MDTYAAVMTGKGTAALSVIQLHGPDAAGVLREIFPSGSGRGRPFRTGAILVGAILDGEATVDQVTVGCEGPQTFALGCHGNPLIVERIMQLLVNKRVAPIAAEEMLARAAGRQVPNMIAVEAQIALSNVHTLTGARIISHQVSGGLAAVARGWLEETTPVPLEVIRARAERILADSRIAEKIINGCTVVLAGPPNSGKSTLLNRLCGRDKAIVTDIPGTTRDWVSGVCLAEPLELTIIDTAGLDTGLAAREAIDSQAQRKTLELLETADVVLWVLDLSGDLAQCAPLPAEIAGRKPVIAVLNKSDLPHRLDLSALPKDLEAHTAVSAERGDGIDGLLAMMLRAFAVDDFDPHVTVAFTDRQRRLIEALSRAEPEAAVRSILTTLLVAPDDGGQPTA
ncbi:MAG TPA: GTP-binding protein [Phycisphaerales bacterium]|nr:GTP-binding protein [Phycisphaerales bacterium]